MDDARRWWESKKVELQKTIDEVLKKSDGEEKRIYELMIAMIDNTKIKETK
jgi:hypothetical protein